MAGGENLRDIDAIINALARAHPDLVVEQWQARHPGADDDGLWLFRHPASDYEVQLESTTGSCPFLFETDAHASPATADTIGDAILLVPGGLALAIPAT